MKSNHFLVIVAFLAMGAALLAAAFSYYSLSSFRDLQLTGFVSQANATLNLTVASLLSINFTNNTINWGSGFLNAGASQANLTTLSTGGTINAVGGSWSITPANGSSGFVLINIGNVNATINLQTTKNSTTLLGGTNPLYQFNVSLIEAGSCLNNTGGTDESTGGLIDLDIYHAVNITDPGTPICGRFPFADSSDSIRIGVRLGIPQDSLLGALSDTFIMTYCEAPGPC